MTSANPEECAREVWVIAAESVEAGEKEIAGLRPR